MLAGNKRGGVETGKAEQEQKYWITLLKDTFLSLFTLPP